MPSGQRTSGEDLRPELVFPGAARTGHFNEIRKAQPFVPGSVPPAQGKKPKGSAFVSFTFSLASRAVLCYNENQKRKPMGVNP